MTPLQKWAESEETPSNMAGSADESIHLPEGVCVCVCERVVRPVRVFVCVSY